MSESHKRKLDNQGKRTDITDIGRTGMIQSKLGDKNPMYKRVDEITTKLLIEEYRVSKQITTEMITIYGISKYLITRILKSKGVYERKRQSKTNNHR
jgi:hypothetical protein